MSGLYEAVSNEYIGMRGLVADRNTNGWYAFICMMWRSELDKALITQMKPFKFGSVIKFKTGFKFFLSQNDQTSYE